MIGDVVPMKNQAIIDPTDYGYLFRAGQQHTELEISTTNGGLRFHDLGTASWKWLPNACRPDLRGPRRGGGVHHPHQVLHLHTDADRGLAAPGQRHPAHHQL